ncbi:MAG: hypothetical protein JZU65_11795 [Chlorobium sp.]|jgi:hypothetical protein|nr:hypothetical protein [Chlorobium sp.]
MSHTAKSVFAFGIYELLLGPALMIMPDSILAFFDFPESKEVWIRVAGALVSIFAFYDIQAARCELTDYFRLSVYARSSVMLFFTVFVLSGLAKPMLMLFGVVDLPGAIWTARALRPSPSFE